jgi:hypothetical protein
MKFENFKANRLANSLRSVGQKIYKFGSKVQGDMFKEDRCILFLTFFQW